MSKRLNFVHTNLTLEKLWSKTARRVLPRGHRVMKKGIFISNGLSIFCHFLGNWEFLPCNSTKNIFIVARFFKFEGGGWF